jgi:hypothetical protein
VSPVLFRLFRLGIAGALILRLLVGCASHPHRAASYDRAISEDERDPTYRPDPERADEEVRDVQ